MVVCISIVTLGFIPVTKQVVCACMGARCCVRGREYIFLLVCYACPHFFCSGLSAGIYTTNGPEACWYVLNDCKANIVIVENEKQLNKILQVMIKLINKIFHLRLMIVVTFVGARSPSSLEGNCAIQGKTESSL